MKFAVILFFTVCLAISLSSANPYVLTKDDSEIAVAKGGGKYEKGSSHSSHKAGKKSGKESKHDKEVANKGQKGSELHRIEDEDEGGKKLKHFAARKHESFHSEGGESAHGAKYEEGSKRNRGNYKKGFFEKFHKDELKNHDSFFSNGAKSGSYNIFGKKSAKYGSESFAKKSGGNFKNLKSEGKHGKSGKKAGGHNKSEKKGHKGQKSSKSHYAHNEKHAKKGGKKGGKQYRYKHGH